MTRVSLCVYCGSRPGLRPAYAEAAREVGRLIGERGWRLVYGGGRSGLMGEVADAALAHGAEVIGVIPESLMAREQGHRGVTELHVVQTMHERKKLMAEHADAFVALPGGIGTFEELFEVWTWLQLGYHAKPIGLLDAGGYYQPFLAMMAHTVTEGFFTPEQMQGLIVSTTATELLDRIAGAARPDPGAQYARI